MSSPVPAASMVPDRPPRPRLAAGLWRDVPYIALGLYLGAATVLDAGAWASVPDAMRLVGLAGAALAIGAPLAVEDDPPGVRGARLAVRALLIGAGTPAMAALVSARANSFFSAPLLLEGAIILLSLHLAQRALRRLSRRHDVAAPRAADALTDGVRMMLLGSVLLAAAAWRSLSAVAWFLALAFSILAIVLRAPEALASITRRRGNADRMSDT